MKRPVSSLPPPKRARMSSSNTGEMIANDTKLRVLRIVQSESEERKAERHLKALIDQIRIAAEVRVIRSDDPPQSIIRANSASAADLVFLGMSAGNGDEVTRFLHQIDPLLEGLPTAILVWSNGEADVFA